MKLYTELAEYYYSIENHTRNINNDVALIKNLSKTIPSPQILDLGCGSAEHLNLLAKVGFRCTGLDASSEMIRIAQKRFPKCGNLFTSSMTNFDFFEEFDIISCLFGSFDYLLTNTDVESTLWNSWRALKPDGIAVFEIWNALPLHLIKERPLTHVSTTYFQNVQIDRNRGFKLSERQLNTIVDVDYVYKISSSFSTRTVKDHHRMRAYKLEEIEKLIENNGFMIENIFSNNLMDPYKKNSNKLLLVLKKKQ